MPEQPKIIAEFPKCYICGSTERVSELACAEAKEKGKVARDVFTSLRKEVVSIEQPTIAGVMVQAALSHFDACGKCGAERCTRSELIKVPIQVQGMPQGKMPPFFNNPRKS